MMGKSDHQPGLSELPPWATMIDKKLIRWWDSECELFLRRHLQPFLRNVSQKLPNSVK